MGADSGGLAVGVGDKAPAFKLPTDDGRTITLAALKGTPFVVYFYPKDDTSGCTKEALAFSAALPKFARAGVTVIGVSKDSLESHAKFRGKHKLKVTLGSDAELKMAQDWGVWAKRPSMAASIWAWSAPPFWSTPRASLSRPGARLKFPAMSRRCWRRQNPYETPAFSQAPWAAVNLALVFLAQTLDRAGRGG